MTRKKSKIIQIVAMALIVAIVIAENCAAAYFKEIISIYLYGFGNDFSNFDTTVGNETCLEIESEGIVLLKNNDDALPLKDSEKNSSGKYPVSVFGWGATDGGFITSGSGSGGSAERGAGKLVTLLGALEGQDALTDKQGNVLLPEVQGQFEYYHPLMEMYAAYKSGRDVGDYWNAAYPFFNLIEPSVDKVQPHLSGAKEHSSTAIVVISRVGGEGQDIPRIQKKYDKSQQDDNSRTYLQISTEEEDLLALVKDNFDKVIVIVNACNTMDLSFLDDDGIDAAISVSGAGQSGAIAIAQVLTGEINPSGRTVDTYAYDLTTAATYANAPDCREVNGPTGGERAYTNGEGNYIDYAEGIYVGYKWYETADSVGFWNSDFAMAKWGVTGYDDVVQYPFGYGLSYADFDWDVVSVSPANGSEITADTEITIQVKVTNVGSVAGKDVVEVYYTPEYHGTVEKSSVNLVAFAKTDIIDNGGNQLITLKFKASDMKSYDTFNASGAVGSDGGYVLEHGSYKITLRTDSHNVYNGDDATIIYNVASDIAIDADTVSNRFTGDGVMVGDVAIDGSDTNEGITYLTRADFQGTFPIPRDARAMAPNMPANGWLTDVKDTDVMPTQGKSGSLELYKNNEELNLELILQLGKDYDDPMWDELLNQITVQELYGVVQGGGFRTKAIASINKPEHMDLDGPSGLNQEVNSSGLSSTLWTSFPVSTVLAQSWNANLSYKYGLMIGYEAYATGVAGWYAPAANIHRSPFDGRNFEYYSEDAILSGVMCAETVRGATNNGLYCYVKHFAVNETENKREGLYTWLNEQSLREIYLRSFEIAVKDGHANAIMSAFNRVGATWSGGNYALLTGVLRNEWGFRGSVITDYALAWEMEIMDINQGLRAGNDFWLNGLRTDTIGTISNKDSATSVSLARTATKNVLYTYCNTVYRQSLFMDNPDVEEGYPIAEITGKAATQASNAWIWGVIAIDVVAAVGIGVWCYFLFFKRKKQDKTEN